MARRSDEQLLCLPEVKDLGKTFNKSASVELAALIREAHSLRDAEKRLKEVKARIVELAQGSDGVRVGAYCAIVSWVGGKRTLSREMLVNNGVTPEQIEESMVEGEGHWQCELPQIQTGV